MKQFRFSARRLAAITLAVLASLAALACVRLPRDHAAPAKFQAAEGSVHTNINTASAQEIEQLPGVGKVIAERIVAYREQHGRFRRPEELLMVDGVSDKKFRGLRSMVGVE